MITHLAKSLKIGPGLLRVARAYEHGLAVECRTFAAKRRYLKQVASLVPIASDAGPVDCFMLLNEARLWEGLWSLYSFRYYFGVCRFVILNDGTLTRSSVDLIQSLLPGASIPDFNRNNDETLADLERRGLRRTRQWRDRFVFFKKLVDPLRLARTDAIVLLDSDCLHFRRPDEVHTWLANPSRVRYIADILPNSFCAPENELIRMCGTAPPPHFCAGFLCVPKHAVDLDRVERYLEEDCFERQLSSGRFSHVAEQTLYAMEAGLFGAERLPPRYATCPDLNDSDTTMGHFCGGSATRTWFYSKGLPMVLDRIGRRPSAEEPPA